MRTPALCPIHPVSPWMTTSPSSRRWTLVLTSTAFFMVVLDAMAVVTALPVMHHDLGASLQALQWTLNAYGLAWATAISMAAALGERYGRRRAFAIGLLVFSAGSAACALASTPETLIAARVLQGVGAGVIMPLSLTILTTSFAPERRGAMVGLWGGIAGLAATSGPVIGGAVTQGLSWHWIFWVNVPIGLMAAVAVVRHVPDDVGSRTPLDAPAVILASMGAVGIVFGLMNAADQGWTTPGTLTTLLTAMLLLGAFVLWELRAGEPMLPMRLFRSATFSAANTTSFFLCAAQYGGAFLVVQYLQLARGLSPVDTGVRLLPWTVTPLLVNPLAGALSDRIGRRPLLVVGMTLQATGLAWFGLQAASSADYWPMMLPLVIAGVSASAVAPVAPAGALSAVAPADIGRASAVNSMLQRFGSAFGVALTTTVFAVNGSLESAGAVTAGLQPALVVAAGLAVLGALSALGTDGRSRITDRTRVRMQHRLHAASIQITPELG